MILTPAMRLNGRGTRADLPAPNAVAAGHLFCVEDEGFIVLQAVWAAIVSSSIANPSVITTSTPHKLLDGQTVRIFGHVGSVPALDGDHVATVTGDDTFTVPVDVTTDGADGHVAAWVPFSPGIVGFPLLTADPADPADDTVWYTRTGSSPAMAIDLKVRVSGVTHTFPQGTV